MKILKTTLVLLSVKLCALQVTAHANVSIYQGDSIGVGISESFNIYRDGAIQLEIGTSMHFSPYTFTRDLGSPYSRGNEYIMTLVNFSFPFSDNSHLLIGFEERVDMSTRYCCRGQEDVGSYLGYKYVKDNITFQIGKTWHLFDEGISIQVGKKIET